MMTSAVLYSLTRATLMSPRRNETHTHTYIYIYICIYVTQTDVCIDVYIHYICNHENNYFYDCIYIT